MTLHSHKHFSELITDDLEVDTKFLVDSNYNVSMSDLVPWSYAYLVINKNEGLPNLNRQSITYIKPPATEVTQQTINLSLERASGLYYRLHTSLQGGSVGESDSLFHILNIIDVEGSCAASTERLFQNYTNLVLNGTQIDFANRDACLQFRNHSDMVLPPTDLILVQMELECSIYDPAPQSDFKKDRICISMGCSG